MKKAHPSVKIVTTAIDEKLNERKYIVPGAFRWGDSVLARFF